MPGGFWCVGDSRCRSSRLGLLWACSGSRGSWSLPWRSCCSPVGGAVFCYGCVEAPAARGEVLAVEAGGASAGSVAAVAEEGELFAVFGCDWACAGWAAVGADEDECGGGSSALRGGCVLEEAGAAHARPRARMAVNQAPIASSVLRAGRWPALGACASRSGPSVPAAPSSARSEVAPAGGRGTLPRTWTDSATRPRIVPCSPRLGEDGQVLGCGSCSGRRFTVQHLGAVGVQHRDVLDDLDPALDAAPVDLPVDLDGVAGPGPSEGAEGIREHQAAGGALERTRSRIARRSSGSFGTSV